jgi:hypothetical protein
MLTHSHAPLAVQQAEPGNGEGGTPSSYFFSSNSLSSFITPFTLKKPLASDDDLSTDSDDDDYELVCLASCSMPSSCRGWKGPAPRELRVGGLGG